MKKSKIVIAGGGFVGLYTAKHFDKHLACRTSVEVTLISRENLILFHADVLRRRFRRSLRLKNLADADPVRCRSANRIIGYENEACEV
jgi:NADH dehydrogenase FAD-containing subunit